MIMRFEIEDDIKLLSRGDNARIDLGDGEIITPLVNLVNNILIDFWALQYEHPTMEIDDFSVAHSAIGRIRGDISMCVDALIKVLINHFNSLLGVEKANFYRDVYQKTYIRPMFLMGLGNTEYKYQHIQS